MESDDLGGEAALHWTGSGWPEPRGTHAVDRAEAAVEALYQGHAVGLIRLAYLMLGDRTNTDGSMLAVANLRGLNSLGIVRGHTYTPIPWSTHIATAAW